MSALLAWSLAAKASALPVYRRLASDAAGRRLSCLLCHDPQSWESTAFGEAFSEAGRDLSAPAEAGKGDIDGDGFEDFEELKAGASPIDPASTPKKPGDWLQRVPPHKPPERKLKDILPGASLATVEEGELPAGAAPPAGPAEWSDEERLQVLYAARREGKDAGGATYAATPGKEPRIVLLAVDAAGRILAVKNSHDTRSVAPELLKSYVGKTPSEAAKLGKDDADKALSQAVARAAAALLLRLKPAAGGPQDPGKP